MAGSNYATQFHFSFYAIWPIPISVLGGNTEFLY